MADPTIAAYSRVNRRGTPRLSSPPPVAFSSFQIDYDVEYYNKFPIWTKIRDCYDGEDTIKDAGQTYLPRLAAHKDPDYAAYKLRAYFYNGVRRTHTGLMGSLFRKPVEITLPPPVADKIDLNRVTLDCQTAAEFCHTLAHELLLVGRFGILVDFKQNLWQKPYLAGYTAENILYHRYLEWEGRKVVDRIILTENEVETTEFSSVEKPIVRILRLDPQLIGGQRRLVYSQTILRPTASDTGTDAVQTNITPTITGRTLDYIPFVFVNPTSLKPEIEHAPLEDIAAINISHYQSTAHLEHGRFYAGMPTYVTAGDSSAANDLMNQVANASGNPNAGTGLPSNALTVGPQFVWELEKDAKAWLLEFTGHGLTFLENAVDSKQLQMQSLGGRLISSTRRAAAMSDEAWRLLESGDEATLMDVAITCDSAMSRALSYLADIRGVLPATANGDPLKSGIVVEFNKEFVPSELTARELRALQSLAERGHIPLDIMYYALREVGVVPIEYTLDDFKKLMDQQNQIWQPPPLIDPATGKPIPIIPPNPGPGRPGGGSPTPPKPNSGPPSD